MYMGQRLKPIFDSVTISARNLQTLCDESDDVIESGHLCGAVPPSGHLGPRRRPQVHPDPHRQLRSSLSPIGKFQVSIVVRINDVLALAAWLFCFPGFQETQE
jgi:hypothetical protein